MKKITNFFMWSMLGVTVFSFALTMSTYFKDISLHTDEALLVANIVPRSLYELVSTPLMFEQAAPVLYILVIKVFGMLLGYTEESLRVYSLFMLVGVLILEWILLIRIFKIEKGWAAFSMALTATYYRNIFYATMIKPYMGDVFWIFFVLLLYLWIHKNYTHQLRGIVWLGVGYGFIVLLSLPALFFIAAVFFMDVIYALNERNWKRLYPALGAGIWVLIVFILHYFLWLRASETEYMVESWVNNAFVVWPLNFTTFKTNLLILVNDVLGKKECVFIPFAMGGFVLSWVTKNRLTMVITMALILALCASSLGKYPLTNRLWLFIPTLLFMYTAICLNMAMKWMNRAWDKPFSIGVVLLACLLLLAHYQFIFWMGNTARRTGLEFNPLIRFLQQQADDETYVYVAHLSVRTVKFKNGYENSKIGTVSHDNIIWGVRDDDITKYINCGSGKLIWNPDYSEDIHKILSVKHCYILLQGGMWAHFGSWPDNFFNDLEAIGYLHKVGEFYKTPLFYFTTEVDDPRRNEQIEFN